MEYSVLQGLKMFDYDIAPNTLAMWQDASGLTVWDKNCNGADIDLEQISSLINTLQQAYEYIQQQKERA